MAISYDLKQFKPYVWGAPQVQLFCDHHSLARLLQQKDLSSRQARYLDFFADFDFSITYIQGPRNRADSLSSIQPGPPICYVTLMSSIDIDPLKQQIREIASQDPHYQNLLKTNNADYVVDDQLLYHQPNSKSTLTLVIPNDITLKQQILKEAHITPYAGHKGHHHLALAEFAYNNAKQTATNQSPFYLNYGREITVPITLLNAQQIEPLVNENPNANRDFSRLQKQLQSAYYSVELAKRKMANRFNQSAKHNLYTVGDQVLLSTKNLKLKGFDFPKLTPLFVGPYLVKGVGRNTVQLEVPGVLSDTFSINRIRHYHHNGRFIGKYHTTTEYQRQ